MRNADEFANPPIRVKRQTSQFLFPVFPAVIFADPLKNIRVLEARYIDRALKLEKKKLGTR